MARPTIDELRESKEVLLTVDQAQTALGVSAQRIMEQARTDPKKLGFPVMVACDTVRIPRKPLLKWLGVEE